VMYSAFAGIVNRTNRSGGLIEALFPLRKRL